MKQLAHSQIRMQGYLTGGDQFADQGKAFYTKTAGMSAFSSLLYRVHTGSCYLATKKKQCPYPEALPPIVAPQMPIAPA